MSQSDKRNGFTRQRSASLKERIFNVKDRRRIQSTRGQIQSSGTNALRAHSEEDLKVASTTTTKYKLIKDVGVRVCNFDNSTLNPWERFMNKKKFPWRWDACTLILGETELYASSTTSGVFKEPIPYNNIVTWLTCVGTTRLPFNCIQLCAGDLSCLIQTTDPHKRDRLLQSVQWKRNVCKYEKILFSTHNPDGNLKELQELITLTLEGPIYIEDTHNKLLEIVTRLLTENQGAMNAIANEALIMTLAPLFEKNEPSIEICNFFTKHCRACPRSRVVIDMFLPVVIRILKYNTNFGKNMWLRTLVKEYVQALSMQNDGEAAVRSFVQTIHGPLSICPHKRILNNLVAICLSSVYDSYASEECDDMEKKGSFSKKAGNRLCDYIDKNTDLQPALESFKSKYSKNLLPIVENNNILDASAIKKPVKMSNLNIIETSHPCKVPEKENKSETNPDVDTALLFMQVLDEISTFGDWLPGLAVLLQPVPFQTVAMQNKDLMRYVVQIIERFAESENEDIVWCLISVREQKDGWLQILSPTSNFIRDEGKLFTKMISAILTSAKKSSKVKRFAKVLLNSCQSALVLLALRENKVMIEILCLMLEYKLTSGKNEVQIMSTLRSTQLGSTFYERLCEQETIIRQKGGPCEYTLPPQSTDQDLLKFLNGGSYGNLQDLNLSFTYVSCKSADIISRLPALQHLNLWSSQIQDVGLRRLCEKLNLTSLNLCETSVTDDSIMCLKDMTNLTNLNLNSTWISEQAYLELRESLPNLVKCDITYTDAGVWHE